MTKRTTVREARRTLPAIMKGSEAIPVGDYYRLRAIIVPIPTWDTWNERSKRAALRKARAAFAATLAAQLPRRPRRSKYVLLER